MSRVKFYVASFEPVKLTCFALDTIKTARYNARIKAKNAEREKIGSMRAVSCSRRALAYFFDTSLSEYQSARPCRPLLLLSYKVVFFYATPIFSPLSKMRLRFDRSREWVYFFAQFDKLKKKCYDANQNRRVKELVLRLKLRTLSCLFLIYYKPKNKQKSLKLS